MSNKPLNISEEAKVQMPFKTVASLIIIVALGTMGYFQMVERLNITDTRLQLMEKDLEENTEFRIKWPRGQLGSFDTIDRNKPFQVNDNINWTKPSAGGSHSHAAVYSFLPNAPTSISVKNADTSNYAGHNELEITWVNPDSYIDGVTHYILEYSSNGGSTYTALPHTQSLSPPKTRIQYFNPLLSLIFRVKAVNRNGESLYSPVSTPISSVALIDPNYCDTVFLTHFNGDVEEPSERDAFFKDYSKNNYQLNPST